MIPTRMIFMRELLKLLALPALLHLGILVLVVLALSL